MYTTSRSFPVDPSARLAVVFAWVNVGQLSDVDLSSQVGADSTGPVVIPTARDVRLEFRSLTGDYPGYIGNDRARRSRPVSVDLHEPASTEPRLFRPLDPPASLKSVFLRNDPIASTPATAIAVQPQTDPTAALLARLANATGLLVADDDTIIGPEGQRVLFGCNGLKHRLSPEAGSLTLTHVSELANLWVTVLRAEIDRDWTWKGAASPSVTVHRTRQLLPGVAEDDDLATVELMHSVNSVATRGDVNRDRIVLVYLDAFTAPTRDGLPYEIALTYKLNLTLESAPAATTTMQTLLPVTTPPAQAPEVVSAGHALSPYVTDDAYAATAPRTRMLWLEMAAPPIDPRDAYFVRVTAHSPDPMLLAATEPVADPVGETMSILDPELVRVIVPGQADDLAGLATMQQLIPASGSGRHFLVPLPPDTTPGSPELFGFYSYEIRVGRLAGTPAAPFWSTAQGRFGPALAIQGVQHPPPALSCVTTRLDREVVVTAPYAQPFYCGQDALPTPPNTDIWVALYVQVHQADGAAMRNVLLDLRRGAPSPGAPTREQQRVAQARWDDVRLSGLLDRLRLDRHAPLSVLAVEVLPEPNGGFRDPLGGDLGDVRILRTSALSPLGTACCS
jgi:hypothetical protein